ncbi:ubiquinone anaerobic biosynthesis protein UbiV [Oryzibacter oryziterrae]|uniref:ubiquinone anaerobic biosynthesis protein UbiV n=1 Tax=Oryzibacter oryziterrae TaxID=2766474 RepID=UPI001EFF6802|nr:U32 family peptidase [Oryzibacter oryziterrae]
MTDIALSLGPVFFNWSPDRLRDFYARIADEADVDRVFVGEVVCGKRMPFNDPVWPDVVERLTQAGKTVILSTLALPSNIRDRKAVKALCEGGASIEINDLTAMPAMGAAPFAVGPFVNVYNEGAASFLANRGANLICLPVELPLSSVGTIARACPDVTFEVFAFGRLPLAVSGRCYHARLHGLHKDSCQFICDRDPDGLPVDTLDGQDFLAINGIQTLSHSLQVWSPSPEEAANLGVRSLRLSPHTLDMVAVSALYRRLCRGEASPQETRAKLRELPLPGALVDGFTRGIAGAAKAAS